MQLYIFYIDKADFLNVKLNNISLIVWINDSVDKYSYLLLLHALSSYFQLLLHRSTVLGCIVLKLRSKKTVKKTGKQ